MLGVADAVFIHSPLLVRGAIVALEANMLVANVV